MTSVFDVFADKVRLNLLDSGGVVLQGAILTIGRDGDGKICALSIQDADDEVKPSAAAMGPHLGQAPVSPADKTVDREEFVGQPSPGAAVAAKPEVPKYAADTPLVPDDAARAEKALAEANRPLDPPASA